MASGVQVPVSIILLLAHLLLLPSLTLGWGTDGHLIVCRIAQARLSEEAAEAVEELLPDYANNDLSGLCSWADHVKFRYRWSSPLHYVDTPDSLCGYSYDRDCKDVETGEAGICVSGAINNYTNQLLSYGSSGSAETKYNLTEALLFLSHFMGDVHQPLHVGFTSDRGGNTIDVHWFTKKEVLHHVWDTNIIETAEERFYNSSVENLIDEINRNITGDWADQVKEWEKCSFNEASCPDVDATESIHAACEWAYKNVTEGLVLEDEYFLTSLPVVKLRLAQAGVRLAATLNRVFGDED